MMATTKGKGAGIWIAGAGLGWRATRITIVTRSPAMAIRRRLASKRRLHKNPLHPSCSWFRSIDQGHRSLDSLDRWHRAGAADATWANKPLAYRPRHLRLLRAEIYALTLRLSSGIRRPQWMLCGAATAQTGITEHDLRRPSLDAWHNRQYDPPTEVLCNILPGTL